MRMCALAIGVALLTCGPLTAHAQESLGGITVTILYDNTAAVQGTTPSWGFSCFIQTASDTILLDGGMVNTMLLQNASILGVDLSSTKRVFLSHDHRDHAGGLKGVLPLISGVPVYVGSQFRLDVVHSLELLGGRPEVVTGPVKISNGIFSTGELPSSIGTYEHGLVMDTDSGLVVVVGCSHPDIVEIVKRAKEAFGKKIFAVFGGFHLLELTEPQTETIVQELRALGVRKCGPTHCTGEGPIKWIAEAFGADYMPMGVGRVLRFSISGSGGQNMSPK